MTEENRHILIDGTVDQWASNDLLAVHRKIDTRLSAVAAIEVLAERNSDVDSQRLHRKIASSRWIFGTHFDSFEYSSNVALRKVARQMFATRDADIPLMTSCFRPDLLVCPDSTISLSATATHSGTHQLARHSDVLLIVMKNGHSIIDRKDIYQTEQYVEELRSRDVSIGWPHFHAYVVGSEIAAGVATARSLRDDKVAFAHIHAVTYNELVEGARLRLLNLRANVSSLHGDFVAPWTRETLAAS